MQTTAPQVKSSETTETLSGELPEAETYQVGQRICDRYVLLERIGAGGMACVWRAFHECLGTEVALKLTFCARGAVANRMVREARLSARLKHPGIVRVFDAGVAQEGEPFVAMELLQGVDLGAWIEREQCVPAATAVALLLPVLDALSFCHAQGVVHRDLKPENIFLEEQEGDRVRPKLVDFGIATAPEVDRLTRPGDMLGTPSYMSPEQTRGLEIDSRSDLWSTCVVLYELMEGHQPFIADNYYALLQCIQNEALQRPLFARKHPELWKIVERGLRKNPADRWQDARSLGVALARWLAKAGGTEDVTGAPLHPAWADDGDQRRRPWRTFASSFSRGRRLWATGAAASIAACVAVASTSLGGATAKADDAMVATASPLTIAPLPMPPVVFAERETPALVPSDPMVPTQVASATFDGTPDSQTSPTPFGGTGEVTAGSSAPAAMPAEAGDPPLRPLKNPFE